MKAIEAIIDPSGEIRLVEPVQVTEPTRAIVTILESPAIDAETARLAEASLAEDWQRPEEDEAWAHLQPGKSF